MSDEIFDDLKALGDVFEDLKPQPEAPLRTRVQVEDHPTVAQTILEMSRWSLDIASAPVAQLSEYIRENWSQDEIEHAYLTSKKVNADRTDPPRYEGEMLPRFDTTLRPHHVIRLIFDLRGPRKSKGST